MRSRIVVGAGRAVALAVTTVVVFGIGATSAEAATTPADPPAAIVGVPGGPEIGPQGAQSVDGQGPPADGVVGKASVGLDDGIGGGVGIAAIILGIGGMGVGIYRRRRGLATQAEGNQRR